VLRPHVQHGSEDPDPAELDVEQVYRMYVGYVFRLIQRFGVTADEVEDATQEVFIIVHRRLPDFDPERGTLRTWLFSMARGVAANRRRGRERRLRVVLPGEARDRDQRPSPEQQVRHRETLERVGHFLTTLPPHQREVFELIDIEGLRGPEVSEALGVNLNTIYTRLRLARQAFKRFAGTLGADADRGVTA
jgi:RNA polymerase sigma-70 factor (ECF subfamily)